MNIGVFASEFTKDLEACVRSPLHITPQETWDPRKPAAPERHAQLGTAAGHSIQDQIYMLEQQNQAFEVIESMLRLFNTPKTYGNQALDPVKEQVWMFGYKWLDIYYGLLTQPQILRSEFYRKDHERFLGLCSRLLHPVPSARCTFIQALRSWDPGHMVFKPDADAVSATAAWMLPISAVSAVTQPMANPSTSAPLEQAPSVHAPLPPLQPPQHQEPERAPRQRLVLAPRSGHEERNKTRKSPRN